MKRIVLLMQMAAILAVLLCASCAKQQGERVPVYPVRGRVTVNGLPAENAEVGFYPLAEGQRLYPRGRVQADGSFQMSTYELNDGAPPGEYVVTIVWRDPPPPGSASDAPEGPDRLKNRFGNYQTSKLRAQVQAADNEQPPFDLK